MKKKVSSDHTLACPTDYTAVGNRCLRATAEGDKRNFDDAESYCSSFDGYLASVHSGEDNGRIIKKL